jgi:hypothetical protein
MENQLIKLAEAAPRPSQTGLPETLVHPRPGLETGWEVVIGTIVGVTSSAEALVQIARISSSAPMKARTVVSISEKDIGQQAVLAFEDGDLTKPIILGLIRTAENFAKKVTVGADGDKFVVTAEREIELRCGEASITLTRAGKVLIKGEYVLTRAKRLNRIKGAAVSIN